jgi:hypothetical protein
MFHVSVICVGDDLFAVAAERSDKTEYALP